MTEIKPRTISNTFTFNYAFYPKLDRDQMLGGEVPIHRTGEFVEGQVKDGLLVSDRIGLGLLMGSLMFSLLAVPTVP